MSIHTRLVIVIAGLAAAAATPEFAGASDCTRTSVGVTPLNDLGAGLYLGQFQGGLYPGGVNAPPVSHASAGLAKAALVVPRDDGGTPAQSGKVVLLSIGLSNTTQEFCGGAFPNCQSFSFIGQAAASPLVNHTSLVIVDGAMGGQTPSTWDMPTDANYTAVRNRLTTAGVTEAQVQAVWIKEAQAQPSIHLPSAAADAYTLERGIGNMVRACKVRYPNLRLVYLSSRIYAGYASTTLNPEPYAFETGFSVKWLIEAQIDQRSGGGVDPIAGDLDDNTVAPWLAWGPYLWADGLTPRSDGLTWACADLNTDGTHPANSGRAKVGGMILSFLLAEPTAANWFRAGTPLCPADFNTDGQLSVQDIFDFLAAYFGNNSRADFNLSGSLGVQDIFDYLAAYFAGCP